MDEWSLYRIDRYIQQGGRVFFALDSIDLNIQEGLAPRTIIDQGLLAMVSFYGATVKPALVLDQNALTWPLRTQAANGMAQLRFVRYPLWIGIRPEAGNRAHPVSSSFDGVDLFWANPLELNTPEQVQAEALFTTTDQGWLMTKDFAVSPEQTSYLFSREEAATRGPQIMAAALSGTFPSWFEGVDKPFREGEELPDMPETPQPSRIIVIGDTDFISFFIRITESEKNLNFMIKAADWLGNDDDIIGISSRSAEGGRLDKITDALKRRQAVLWSQALNVIIMPLALIVFAVYRSWKRRAGERSFSHEL
jgi:ABC-type uncharacterized transport system involved in gliding motility auxiliary subunit